MTSKTPDAELLAVFRQEAVEALDDLSRLLDSLESAPGQPGVVAQAFRACHNLKGGARTAGTRDVAAVAHALENGLSACRTAGRVPSQAFKALMRRALGLLWQAVRGDANADAMREIAGNLEAMAAEDVIDANVPVEATATEPPRAGGAPSAEDNAAAGPDGTPTLEPSGATMGVDTVRVEVERLDRLMGFGSQVLSMHGRQSVLVQQLAECHGRLTRAENPDDVRRIAKQLESVLRAQQAETKKLGYVSGDFGAALKALRMQPLRTAVSSWRQTLLEACTVAGKEARLEAEVSDVEIDRQVLDALRAPFLHLLRNAVSHGIEKSGVREAGGKPRVGTVLVRACTRASMVEIEVNDDGCGFNLDSIVQRAIDRKIIKLSDAAELTEERALVLLFAPGFSTTDQIDELSGRGVGLDVVARVARELGGEVRALLVGPLGGAAFSVRVPSTLVSTVGLLVSSNGITYAVPIARVVRTQRTDKTQITTVDKDAAVADKDGSVLRLRRLHDLTGVAGPAHGSKLNIVVVAEGTTRLGLIVDEILGEAEFITKKLPWNIREAPGVSGVFLLDSGQVAPVLDVSYLINDWNVARPSSFDDVASEPQQGRRRVLVVDDSVTTRMFHHNLLVMAGYDVDDCSDGQAAWDQLKQREYDLVVSDVDMPRLSGIELTRKIRAEPQLQRLPIVLVTSLDSPEQVRDGANAGADEYLVKGRFDEKRLIEAVGRLAM